MANGQKMPFSQSFVFVKVDVCKFIPVLPSSWIADDCSKDGSFCPIPKTRFCMQYAVLYGGRDRCCRHTDTTVLKTGQTACRHSIKKDILKGHTLN